MKLIFNERFVGSIWLFHTVKIEEDYFIEEFFSVMV